MAYALTLQSRPGFLHARVTGTNSKETVRGYTQEIHDACVQRNARAVLIEENLDGASIALSDVFQVVTERVPMATGLLKPIALVDLNPEHEVSRMEFAEDLAFNRGINFRLFASAAEAERWLREMPQDATGAR
jgi:hypothetical protein